MSDVAGDTARIAKGFRFSARHVFFTFPQCEVSKETVLERLRKELPISWALVASERHADGNSHLHGVVRFDKHISSRDSGFLDFLTGKHGDYRSPRSVKNALRYCRKEGDYTTYGDVPETDSALAASGRVAPSTRVALLLKEGSTLEQVREEEPGFYLTHKKHVVSLYAEWALVRQRASLLPWPGVSPPQLSSRVVDTCELALNHWLRDNIKVDRPFKAKQLYLWGPPGIGKTSMVLDLMKYLSVFMVPMDEEFYDFYSDELELCVLDEFKAHKRITWLNAFLQGGPMPLRIKGGQLMKLKNLPTIILSNYSLEECYNHSTPLALSSLRERLCEINWTSSSFIRMHLTDLPPGSPSAHTESEEPFKSLFEFPHDSDLDPALNDDHVMVESREEGCADTQLLIALREPMVKAAVPPSVACFFDDEAGCASDTSTEVVFDWESDTSNSFIVE